MAYTLLPDDAPAAPAKAPKGGYVLLDDEPQGASRPGYLATIGGGIGKGIGEVALGAQRLIGRGLQGIGASTPGDWLVNDADAGKAKMAQEFAPYKAANPWTGAGSELAGNVLATLPVGGALGAGAKALGAGAPVVSGLSSGGFTLGSKIAPTGNAIVDAAANLGLRSATGGAVGGASTALVEPDHVGMGAAIGAALPPVLKGLGASGMWLVDKYRQLAAKGDVKGAAELVKALGNGSPDEVAALAAQMRAAPTLVEGGAPTVAQALQTPQASVMEKTVFDAANAASPLHTKLRVTQPAARAAALDSVAPTDANGIASARADVGNALTSRVIPEEKGISKLVSGQYQIVPKAGPSDVTLPVQDMQAAVDKYLGAGAFGENTQPATAVATARKLSAPGGGQPASLVVDSNGAPWRAAVEATPQPAKWAEVSQLRSSLNEAISKARFAGDKQAEAAMVAQKQAIDGAIESDLSPQALAAWKEANASHAAKMERFHTGPQRDIFRTAADGQPVVQSGEVAGKFWNAGGAADKDVQSFRRLIDDNPAMLGQFRSMITTEGLGKEAGRNAPALGDNFVKWVKQHLPGLREAFDPAEVDTLQRIAQDISRNTETNRLAAAHSGSDSVQKASNILKNGFFDNPALIGAMKHLPLGLGTKVVNPALGALANVGKQSKADMLAALLSDAPGAADKLERLSAAGMSSEKLDQFRRLLNRSGQAATRVLPVAASQ